MPHETALLATIAGGLALAFVFGFAAARLRLPPLVGYLLAGVVLGPFTPGYVADPVLASQLAELGVILLMFGVGLHFSPGDLLAVRRIAVPGALAQMAIATALGASVAHLWGWPWGQGLVFGLALSVASTVVVLRALEQRSMLDSADGRIAVGWLIVEDLVMVVALVLLPPLATLLGGEPVRAAVSGAGPAAAHGLIATLALTLGKVTAFVVLMLVGGRRLVPWLLAHVARIGSRELFTLFVLALALGIAVGAAALFGVSFALGAFFAGVVISESDLSHQAAADALPLQDAFAVLFFVSVGMLFDPSVIVLDPLRVLAVVLIVMFGQSLAAFVIVLRFRYPIGTALTVGASLAQIGEFSFILAGLGVTLGLLPPQGHSLILAGALLSITLNPLLFATVPRVHRWLSVRPELLARLERASPAEPASAARPAGAADAAGLRGHVVIVGYGRVGRAIGAVLARHGIPYVVVEQDRRTVEAIREEGVTALSGDAARPGVLERAGLQYARLLVVATPEPYQARRMIELARRANAGIEVVVRTHRPEEQAYFERLGVAHAVMGERELALGMARYAVQSMGGEERATTNDGRTTRDEIGGRGTKAVSS